MVKTGKTLERFVAQAYRDLGARKVEHDVELSGHQIDVYVELETADRGVHRIAVEAKDRIGSVGIEILRNYSLVTERLRQLGLIDEGVIVASSRFTRQARKAASDDGIRLLEKADLETLVRVSIRSLLDEIRSDLSTMNLMAASLYSDRDRRSSSEQDEVTSEDLLAAQGGFRKISNKAFAIHETLGLVLRAAFHSIALQAELSAAIGSPEEDVNLEASSSEP